MNAQNPVLVKHERDLVEIIKDAIDYINDKGNVFRSDLDDYLVKKYEAKFIGEYGEEDGRYVTQDLAQEAVVRCVNGVDPTIEGDEKFCYSKKFEVRYRQAIENLANFAVKYIKDVFAKTEGKGTVPGPEVKQHIRDILQNESKNLAGILLICVEERCMRGLADPEIGYDGCVYFSKKGYPDKYFYNPKKSE